METQTIQEQNRNTIPAKKGDILHHSWGYDMTINEFCKVIEVSKTGKTITCKMLAHKNVNDDGYGQSGSEKASDEFLDRPSFKLRVRTWNWCGIVEYLYKGKYPFCGEADRVSWSKGSFNQAEDRAYSYNYMD